MQRDQLRPPASQSSAFASGIWSVVAICYGGALVIGGWQRFNRLSYYALSLIDGAPFTLGGLFILAGAATLVAQQREYRPAFTIGTWLQILLWLVLVGSIGYSAMTIPSVGFGGMFVFLGIATNLWVLWRMRLRRISR